MTAPLVVLVTGAGGVYGDATIRNLRRSSLPTYVIGADTEWQAAGALVADKAIVLPPVDAPTYASRLIAIVEENAVNAVFISSGTEIRTLASRRDELERKTKALFILPSPTLYKMASDKLATVEFLAAHGFDYPVTVTSKGISTIQPFINRVGFPVMAKPRFGQGSRGLIVCYSAKDLPGVIALEEEYVLQEFLGDEDHEYTVGVLATEKGDVLASIALRRWLKGGQTAAAEVVESPLITAYAEALGAQLQPRGYVNIQLRMRNDRPVAFEINARVSSSTGFRALAGVNEPELILRRYLLNENPPRPKAKMIAMVRGFSERIVEAAIWKEMVPN